jgi:hypothetical protein
MPVCFLAKVAALARRQFLQRGESTVRCQLSVTYALRVVPSGTLRCLPVIRLLHWIRKPPCLALGLTLMAAAELRINATRVR